MKKVLSTLVVLTVGLFLLSGCDKYDEIYNPKCMIKKVWYRSDVNPDTDPSQGVYTAPANELFTYNDEDQITSISILEDRSYQFTYDGDGYTTHITYINSYGLTENITYTYDNEKKKFMTGLEYKIDGIVRQTVSLTRRADKTIASIDIMYDREFFQSLDMISKSSFYNRFIGYDENVITALQKSESKDLTRKSLTQLFYDEEGLNVVRIVTTIPDLNYVDITTLSYDEGLNPFFEMPYTYCANYNGDNHKNTRSSGYNFIIGFSKHNKTYERTESQLFGNVVDVSEIRYNYVYNEANFPRQITERNSKYNNIPTNTFILYVKE